MIVWMFLNVKHEELATDGPEPRSTSADLRALQVEGPVTGVVTGPASDAQSRTSSSSPSPITVGGRSVRLVRWSGDHAPSMTDHPRI